MQRIHSIHSATAKKISNPSTVSSLCRAETLRLQRASIKHLPGASNPAPQKPFSSSPPRILTNPASHFAAAAGGGTSARGREGDPPAAGSREGLRFSPTRGAAHEHELLTMVPMYISNMASWENFSTTLGPIKGKASPLVGEIKIGDGREQQCKQMEGYLAAGMWTLVSAACLPGIATMACPSMAFQAKPQRSDAL